ncbi:MAG: ABC transporter ATP-binding protein [Cyclobacteriaceae bacterium]
MNDLTAILEIIDLTIGYDGKEIQTIDKLTLNPGELVCLLGQNGVGKTTLIKTLSGYQSRLNGSIKVSEKDLGEYSKEAIARKISIVTTDKISAAGLTVMEVLMSGRYPYQRWLSQPKTEDFEAIEKAATLTKINYLLDKSLTQLSDGQRQKVMIARALVQNGDIMLLDEPTAHLDLTNRIEIMTLLRKICVDQQKTMLVTTHELNLALQFADKICLMDFGRKLIEGTPEDLALSGEIQKIFHGEDYEIELMTGRVKHNKGQNLSIEATSELRFWMENALDRNDLGQFSDDIQLGLENEKKVLKWVIKRGISTYKKGEKMSELLSTLKALQNEPTKN